MEAEVAPRVISWSLCTAASDGPIPVPHPEVSSIWRRENTLSTPFLVCTFAVSDKLCRLRSRRSGCTTSAERSGCLPLPWHVAWRKYATQARITSSLVGAPSRCRAAVQFGRLG